MEPKLHTVFKQACICSATKWIPTNISKNKRFSGALEEHVVPLAGGKGEWVSGGGRRWSGGGCDGTGVVGLRVERNLIGSDFEISDELDQLNITFTKKVGKSNDETLQPLQQCDGKHIVAEAEVRHSGPANPDYTWRSS